MFNTVYIYFHLKLMLKTLLKVSNNFISDYAKSSFISQSHLSLIFTIHSEIQIVLLAWFKKTWQLHLLECK